MYNNKSNDDNLLREVIGDYKNDQKTQKNLNEEDENDEYAELYRTGRGSDACQGDKKHLRCLRQP